MGTVEGVVPPVCLTVTRPLWRSWGPERCASWSITALATGSKTEELLDSPQRRSAVRVRAIGSARPHRGGAARGPRGGRGGKRDDRGARRSGWRRLHPRDREARAVRQASRACARRCFTPRRGELESAGRPDRGLADPHQFGASRAFAARAGDRLQTLRAAHTAGALACLDEARTGSEPRSRSASRTSAGGRRGRCRARAPRAIRPGKWRPDAWRHSLGGDLAARWTPPLLARARESATRSTAGARAAGVVFFASRDALGRTRRALAAVGPDSGELSTGLIERSRPSARLQGRARARGDSGRKAPLARGQQPGGQQRAGKGSGAGAFFVFSLRGTSTHVRRYCRCGPRRGTWPRKDGGRQIYTEAIAGGATSCLGDSERPARSRRHGDGRAHHPDSAAVQETRSRAIAGRDRTTHSATGTWPLPRRERCAPVTGA